MTLSNRQCKHLIKSCVSYLDKKAKPWIHSPLFIFLCSGSRNTAACLPFPFSTAYGSSTSTYTLFSSLY